MKEKPLFYLDTAQAIRIDNLMSQHKNTRWKGAILLQPRKKDGIYEVYGGYLPYSMAKRIQAILAEYAKVKIVEPGGD